ncbi:MAG: hypothetical protein K6F32_07455, partial [Bacilli bacterium]|nr:hypothetical protein [Bacilli bacterium]
VTALFTFFVLVFGTWKKESAVFNWPPEIQKVYFEKHPEVSPEKMNGKQRIIVKSIGLVVYLALLIVMAWLGGCKTFLDGFVFSIIVIYWIVAWDTFFLDWVLFTNLKAFRLPGTEHMDKEYHNYWFHLKVVLWPAAIYFVLAAAVVGLIIWALPL